MTVAEQTLHSIQNNGEILKLILMKLDKIETAIKDIKQAQESNNR